MSGWHVFSCSSVPATYTLTYSTVLLLSLSLYVRLHKYAVTHGNMANVSKDKRGVWSVSPAICRCTRKYTNQAWSVCTCAWGGQLEIKQVCRDCVGVLVRHIWVERHEGSWQIWAEWEPVPVVLCHAEPPSTCLPFPPLSAWCFC